MRNASRSIAVPVVLILGVFALLRMNYATSIEPDESDLILFGQQLVWGYSEQPPLYSWLCTLTFAFVGPGALALTIVRTLILALTVLSLHSASRTLIPDSRMARFATYSVVLIPSLTWHSLTYLTHSILLFLASAACLHLVFRIVQYGRTRDYLGLGAACAVGLMAKYNFALFLGALILAAVSLPEVRRRVLDLRMLLTVGIFLVLVSPHLYWMYEHREIIRNDLLLKVSKLREVQLGYFSRTAIGLKELILNSLLTVGPIALTLAVMYRSAQPKADEHQERSPDVLTRLLGRFLFTSFVMMFGLIVINGWDRFHERWLMPFALAVPLWLFARKSHLEPNTSAVRGFLAVVIALALSYVITRTVQTTYFLNRTDGLYPLRVDYRAIGRAIEAEAGSAPLILTRQREVGANLKMVLPNARVCCCFWNLYDLPPKGGPIVIAWNPVIVNGQTEVPWSWIERYWPIAPPRFVPLEAIREIPVVAAGSGGRAATVAFTVLPGSGTPAAAPEANSP